MHTHSHILCGEAIAEEERVRRGGRVVVQGEKNGCISRAAMVTVIHVVDTLELTQSLPPVAAIPLSLSLSQRPPCMPGRVTVQSATTKEAARHCYRKRRRTKAVFLPPTTTTATALITHSASRPFALRMPGRHAHTEWTNTKQQNLELLCCLS